MLFFGKFDTKKTSNHPTLPLFSFVCSYWYGLDRERKTLLRARPDTINNKIRVEFTTNYSPFSPTKKYLKKINKYILIWSNNNCNYVNKKFTMMINKYEMTKH